MSEIWKRKIKTYFIRFDYDQDGIVSKKDLETLASNFAEAEQVNPNQKERLRKAFTARWERWSKAHPGKDGGLTIPMMTESFKTQLKDPSHKDTISELFHAMFEAMRIERDGCLQEDDLRRLFRNLGVTDTTWTKKAFEDIDTDRCGKVTTEQVIKAAIDYFHLQDENSPNSEFFGPLVS